MQRGDTFLKSPEVLSGLSTMRDTVVENQGSIYGADLFLEYGRRCDEIIKSTADLADWIGKVFVETVSFTAFQHFGYGEQRDDQLRTPSFAEVVNKPPSRHVDYDDIFFELRSVRGLYNRYVTVKPFRIKPNIDQSMDSLNDRELARALNGKMRSYIERNISVVNEQLSGQRWVGTITFSTPTACSFTYTTLEIVHAPYDQERHAFVTHTTKQLVKARRVPLPAEGVSMPDNVRELIRDIPALWRPAFYVVDGVLINTSTSRKEDLDYRRKKRRYDARRGAEFSGIGADPALCFGNLVLIGW
jgi:hypothetical protein